MDLLNFLMFIVAGLLFFVGIKLAGIEKKLDRIADTLSKTENRKNEETKNDQQID